MPSARPLVWAAADAAVKRDISQAAVNRGLVLMYGQDKGAENLSDLA
jgi:hypothetical protein